MFQSSNITIASYEIALLIAKKNGKYTIGETLVKPCKINAAKLLLEEKSVYKLSQISLSTDTIQNRIDEISEYIKLQVIKNIRNGHYFSLQFDESTDISHISQLLVHVRNIRDRKVEEECLFCKPFVSPQLRQRLLM